MKKTTVHDRRRQSTIHHLGIPGSSILADASKVVRYQKYAVSEDFAHSSTTVPFMTGHDCQGSSGCKKQYFYMNLNSFSIRRFM